MDEITAEPKCVYYHRLDILKCIDQTAVLKIKPERFSAVLWFGHDYTNLDSLGKCASTTFLENLKK